MKKELYTNMSPETHLSYYLNIILKKDLYPWFYENYINIYWVGNENSSYINFYDNHDDDSYGRFMEERYYKKYNDYTNSAELIDSIIQNIDNDFYALIWIDKYYVPGVIEYNKYHFVHTVMIYGYDDTNKQILCINFEDDKGVCLEAINYDDLSNAFFKGKEFYQYGGSITTLTNTITFIRLKTTYSKLPFDINRFIIELKDYMFSRPNLIKLRYQYFSTIQNSYIHGIQLYDKFIDIVEKMGTHNGLLRSLYRLELHKYYLHDRFKYIANMYKMSEDFTSLVNEYKSLGDTLNKIRMKNIKYAIMNKTSLRSLSTDPKHKDELIKTLTWVKEKEIELLLKIYDYLNNYDYNCDKNEVEINSYSVEKSDSKYKILLNKPEQITKVYIKNKDNHYNRPIGHLSFDDGQNILISDNLEIDANTTKIQLNPPKIVKWIEYDCSRVDVDISLYSAYNSREWDFTKNLSFDWSATHDILDSNFDENYNITVINNDPNITCENININADYSKYVYIKYRTTCDSYVGQLFFNNYTEELDETKSKIITISPNDDYIDYIIDMSDNEKWKGIIKTMRIDPIGYDNNTDVGECNIEYIKVNDIKPVYNSKKDFCKTQGVNGWSYYYYDRGTTYREFPWNDESNQWNNPKYKDLFIAETTQTSCIHYATVRKWTCSSDGEYKVTCKCNKLSDGMKVEFKFKHNHKTIYTENFYENESFESINNIMLERGESISFEFFNEDQDSVQSIEIEVTIEKIK